VPLPAEPLDGSSLRRRMLTRQRTLMKAGWDVVLGDSFVLMGSLVPFTLGATTADERFVIMLGFATLTGVGFFLIAIFGCSIWRPAQAEPRNAAAQLIAQWSDESQALCRRRSPSTPWPRKNLIN